MNPSPFLSKVLNTSFNSLSWSSDSDILMGDYLNVIGGCLTWFVIDVRGHVAINFIHCVYVGCCNK
jgi:hypothetical protein